MESTNSKNKRKADTSGKGGKKGKRDVKVGKYFTMVGLDLKRKV